MDFDRCSCSGKTLARLLRPTILALLAQEEMYGYILVQRLGRFRTFTDSPPDISGVYKTLKAMEEEQLVTSLWEPGDTGPAKRRYMLTDTGKACLKNWLETLKGYRAQIDELITVLHRYFAR